MYNFQIQMLESLRKDAHLEYIELISILDAFQIASGQGYAIGKTKGMLDFVMTGGEIIIKGENSFDCMKIKTKYELSDLIFHIDNSINIKSDKNFVKYFEK